MQIYRNDDSYRIRVYVWNLTHGGGTARPKNEYRIQIASLNENRFEPEIGGKTLILGWWNEAEVFAGFDFNKHSDFLGSSPSIQIREESLRNAHIKGFFPCNKGNQEIAIAFKPNFFVEYVKNLESLHSFGNSEGDFKILEAVAEEPQAINDSALMQTSYTRRTTIVSIRKKLRDTSFQERVLTAYGHRCAICGIQLNLVQAAHIVPVSHEQGTDLTSNGIALCALHHYAYDRGLVYVDEDYSIKVNERETMQLKTITRDGGLDKFVEGLRALILLPPSIPDRPYAEYICIANKLRLAST
jgi:putative restriction endonuclease